MLAAKDTKSRTCAVEFRLLKTAIVVIPAERSESRDPDANADL